MFVGIDTHKYEHTAVAANRFEEELAVFEFKNHLKSIETFIKQIEALAHQEGLSPIFGIEGSGGNGKLLTQHLINNYTKVYEVNPILTKSRRQYATKWDKSDKIDARLVVSILTRKLNTLPQLSIKHTHQTQYLNLDFLVVATEDLVKQQAKIKNQLHRLLHQENPEYRKRFKTVFAKQALAYWKNYCYQNKNGNLLSATRRQLIVWKINQLVKFQKQLKILDGKLMLLIDQSGQKLITMPGVQVRNAARLLAYIKSINRFKTVSKFCRYVGCVPEQRSSGQTKRHTRTKMSHRKLHRTIYAITLTQLRIVPKARKYYDKKLKEGKTKKQARRCLMKRVSCIIYGMMKHQGNYKG